MNTVQYFTSVLNTSINNHNNFDKYWNIYRHAAGISQT